MRNIQFCLDYLIVANNNEYHKKITNKTLSMKDIDKNFKHSGTLEHVNEEDEDSSSSQTCSSQSSSEFSETYCDIPEGESH